MIFYFVIFFISQTLNIIQNESCKCNILIFYEETGYIWAPCNLPDTINMIGSENGFNLTLIIYDCYGSAEISGEKISLNDTVSFQGQYTGYNEILIDSGYSYDDIYFVADTFHFYQPKKNGMWIYNY